MALAMRLDPDDLLPDDDEVKAMEEQQAKAGPQMSPEQERIEIRKLEMQDREKQREHEEGMRERENQIRLAELASKEGITMTDIRAKYGFEAQKEAANLQDRERQRQHEAQSQNAELAFAAQAGHGI
jgi:hypothetical protein